jgi:hypothetical protein
LVEAASIIALVLRLFYFIVHLRALTLLLSLVVQDWLVCKLIIPDSIRTIEERAFIVEGYNERGAASAAKALSRQCSLHEL